MLIFRGLKGNTAHRAGDGTEVTGHATFAAIRITRENDTASISRGEVRFFLRILNRNPLLKGVQEHVPDRLQNAEHVLPPREHHRTGHNQVRQCQRQHHLPAPRH